jgi:hypothetical protein
MHYVSMNFLIIRDVNKLTVAEFNSCIELFVIHIFVAINSNYAYTGSIAAPMKRLYSFFIVISFKFNLFCSLIRWFIDYFFE